MITTVSLCVCGRCGTVFGLEGKHGPGMADALCYADPNLGRHAIKFVLVVVPYG